MGKKIKTISFNEWLKENGFEKESQEKYTINRVYLYELFEENIKNKNFI